MLGTRCVITIDGLASSGKSTLASLLAKRTGFVHINTGLVYRALGLLAIEAKSDLDDTLQICRLLDQNQLTFAKKSGGEVVILINGELPKRSLFDPEISEASSRASRHAEVRQRLLAMQREAFPGESLVVEGRDAGTVVFPGAPLKFFIEADPEVRASRRLSQLKESGTAAKCLKREIEREISDRDRRDQNRPVAPTLAAADAIIIDNSAETLTTIVENMYDFVSKRGLLKSK
ncbi:MAG: (d)CMP kinase [Bdellovibrionales bacterium]|nr:(d)CMP kinase [Bdellovibrionales bacterium]